MNKTETYKQFLFVAGGVFLSVATIMTVVAGAAFSGGARNGHDGNTITVTGTAEVNTKPDIAVITYTLRGEGKDATTAEKDINKDIDAISDALKDAGIEEDDIKTESHSVNPKYVYTRGDSRIDGYEVYHTEVIKVRDLDKASEYYGIITAKNVHSVQGPDYRIEDPIKQKLEAREKAIENARESAKKLTKSLGVRLGKIVSFYENESGGYPMPMMYAAKAEMAMDSVAANIEPSLNIGTETTASNVTVVFRIK